MSRYFLDDILYEIFLHLNQGHTGLQDLHSCLLVDRMWCDTAVKLLWSKPFYYSNHTQLEKIIDVYLDCLDEYDRDELIKTYKFPLKVDFRKPLYPYASFHRHLYYRSFISLVDLWCRFNSPDGSKHPWFSVLMRKLIKLFNECEGFTEKTLHRSLYLIETEKGIGSGFPRDIYFIQPEAMDYTSGVKRLWLSLHVRTRSFSFLSQLGKGYTKVEQLGVFMHYPGSRIYSEKFAEFIKVQKNLRSFQSIYLYPTPDIIDSLELRANSLRHLDFICANFLGCGPLVGLSKCKNLEMLRFRNCHGFTAEIGEPLFTATFPKIKDVTVIRTDCPELKMWAMNLMMRLYPDRFIHNKCTGDVDVFGVINSDFTDNIQFDLNHVREMMLYGLECQVCLKLCIYPVTTPCGHTFCDECITNFMKHNDVCPLDTCRNDLQGHDKSYFYSHPVDSSDCVRYEKRRRSAEILLYEEMSIHIVDTSVPYELGESYTIYVKYDRMIKRCLESYHRKFGIALECSEKLYHDNGTIVEITDAIPRINRTLELTVIAKDRFRVLERKKKDNFDVAKVELVGGSLEETARKMKTVTSSNSQSNES